jgi:hypothetical protein
MSAEWAKLKVIIPGGRVGEGVLFECLLNPGLIFVYVLGSFTDSSSERPTTFARLHETDARTEEHSAVLQSDRQAVSVTACVPFKPGRHDA